MKQNLSAAMVYLIVLSVTSFPAHSETFKPKDGFIPDEKTAIRVAEAVLIPIYGEEQIVSERPFTAKLKNGVWIVTGRLPKGEKGTITKGGVAEIKISKTTGKILSVTHGK